MRLHLRDDFVQAHLRALDDRGAVELGQRQQVLDQLLHPLRFAQHAVQRGMQLLWPVGRSPEQHLQEAVNRGERRPQLMGSIGHEPAHLLLGFALGLE
ncbi:hypothetical protein D3C76_1637860 [compost metagenome]